MPNSKCRVKFIEFSSVEPEMMNKAISNMSMAARYSALNPAASFQLAIRLSVVGDVTAWESSSSTGYLMATEATKHPRTELHFVERGRSLSRTNNSAIEANAGTAYLLRDVVKHDLISEPGTSHICVAMPSARCMGLLASEFGDPLIDISSMHSTASIIQPNLQCLKEAAKLLISVSSRELPVGGQSLGPSVFSEAFLALFVESWPRQGGYRKNQALRPFYVKRAIEWMHANATQKINLEDVAAASGVSIRTLQLGFRNFAGVSPMGYLLNLRLKCAYNDLLNGPATMTIDDIARLWGFTNPGKFSAQIRLKYGQNPLVIRKAQRWDAARPNVE